MNENPYQPPSIQEPETHSWSSLQRGVCPVCKCQVSHFKMVWLPSVVCGNCSTELALGIPADQSIGPGCLLVILLALALVAIALYAAIFGDFFAMVYWLLMIVPLVGFYSMVTRWKCALPYPRSLIQHGRIVIALDSDVAK